MLRRLSLPETSVSWVDAASDVALGARSSVEVLLRAVGSSVSVVLEAKGERRDFMV
jgi:hypothetical protein